MTRLFFLLPALLILVNPGLPAAQDTCYLGPWELDSAYTFENAEFTGGGDNVAMSDMNMDFTMATGSAFLTFSDESDIVYTFDNWIVTFRSEVGAEDSPMPGEMDVSVSIHGDAWGAYVPGDGYLSIWMGGEGVPESSVVTSAWIDLGGQRMDMSELADIMQMFNSESSSIDYRCEGEYLYVNGESAGGAFRNARYTRVDHGPPR